MENIANIRVPVIAAIEGRAHVHSDYALLASVIVAAESATLEDMAHFAAGVAPGDGIYRLENSVLEQDERSVPAEPRRRCLRAPHTVGVRCRSCCRMVLRSAGRRHWRSCI